MVGTSDGVGPHPNCAEGRYEVAQRGSHETQGLEEGTSIGLGGLPGKGVWQRSLKEEKREKVEGRASQAGTEFHTGRCGQWMLMTVDISWGLSLRWALECFNSHNQPWEVGMIPFCSSKTGP